MRYVHADAVAELDAEIARDIAALKAHPAEEHEAEVAERRAAQEAAWEAYRARLAARAIASTRTVRCPSCHSSRQVIGVADSAYPVGPDGDRLRLCRSCATFWRSERHRVARWWGGPVPGLS